MPYQKRTTPTYRRPAYRRRATVNKATKRYVSKKIRVIHPLQWVDHIFDGGNVNTTPTLFSLVRSVITQAGADDKWKQWSQHSNAYNDASTIYQAKYQISFVHYQLRFQQDQENIESSNTFRTLFYSYRVNDEHPDGNHAVLDGADIDLPPHTEFVKSMYFDKMRTLRPNTYIDYTAENTEESCPGTAILKGNRKIGANFMFIRNDEGGLSWEENDIRWEAQSDTLGNGLQLYGFMRIYYRRLQ